MRLQFAVEPSVDGGLVLEHGFANVLATRPVTVGVSTTWKSAYGGVLPDAPYITASSSCDSPGLCPKQYVARGGQTVVESLGLVDAGILDAGGSERGHLKGHSSNVQLVRWKYAPPSFDQPADNPDCIDIAEIDFDLSFWSTPCQPPCVPKLEFAACDGGC